MTFRLSKDNSSDIGFALDCLMCGAIQFREFKAWLWFVIEHDEDPPAWIFDMLDVQKKVDFKAHDLMGWTAGGGLSDPECDALCGISFVRGICDFEDRLSRSDAICALECNPAFADRVAAFFPFLDLSQVVGPDPDKGW